MVIGMRNDAIKRRLELNLLGFHQLQHVYIRNPNVQCLQLYNITKQSIGDDVRVPGYPTTIYLEAMLYNC